MSQCARTAASIDWKRRYAQLLEQQEKQQARYKRKQDLLVNALAQVSQYSRHLDPAADEKLMALRALLRQDNFRNVDLAQVVETLESQLTRSLKDRADKQKQTSKQLSDLVKQAQSMSKSTDLHTRLAELKQAIESQPVQYSTLANHLTSLSQLHALAVKDRRSGQSMLQRWFGPAVPNEAPISLDAISGYLNRLLEEIEHGQEMQGTFKVAQNVLSQGLSLENIEVAVQSVTEVVLAAVSSDRQEMTKYLNDMNERLKTATLNLGVSQGLLREEISLQAAFGDTMQSSVQGLRSQVDAGQDIQQLKLDLHQSLDEMVEAVNENRARGGVLQTQLSEQLSSMMVRAKELEQQGMQAEQKAAEQRNRALTDSLTRLPNREAYEEAAAREVQRWQRYQRPLCLAVCDIDLFKSVNDSYGHVAGDEVLRQVAELLKQRLRGTDFLARYGGEEFVVLLPETERDEAVQVMQSVCELIELSPIQFENKRIGMTISIGVADFRGKDILQSAFTRADRALYQAKMNGRNRVELSAE
jgi:diguanylate cyclase